MVYNHSGGKENRGCSNVVDTEKLENMNLEGNYRNCLQNKQLNKIRIQVLIIVI